MWNYWMQGRGRKAEIEPACDTMVLKTTLQIHMKVEDNTGGTEEAICLSSLMFDRDNHQVRFQFAF